MKAAHMVMASLGSISPEVSLLAWSMKVEAQYRYDVRRITEDMARARAEVARVLSLIDKMPDV